MSELQILNISGVECYEKDGVAYLKLEMVARGLGFTRTAASGNEVVRWERVEGYLEDLNVPACGHDDFIPENIFYRLAMKARNETAEKFQAKVADEIIPSIRKHGVYMTRDTLEKALSSPDFLIKLATKLKDEQERNKSLKADNERMKPKEVFADAVAASKSSILIGELAKILRQNGIDTGEKRLFHWMRQEAFLIRRKGRDYNMPTQRGMELELFEIKERTINNPDGSIRITKTVLVTGKGQQYFINKFLQR
jgi:Uncharacterized phage-encoded protein